MATAPVFYRPLRAVRASSATAAPTQLQELAAPGSAPRGTHRPLRPVLPPGPRPAGGLPARTPARAGLHQPGALAAAWATCSGDLERHHPGIDSLHLPAEVAAAWKQRLRTKRKTVTTAAGGEDVTRSSGSATAMPDPGPGVLPGPGPVGPRGPRPLGAVGRALPHQGGRDQPAQGHSGTASPAWTPAPANGFPSCRCWSAPPTSAADADASSRPPAHAGPATLHRRRAACTAPCRTPAPQHLGRGPAHRQTPRPGDSRKSTRSGPGPSSRSCAPPASASRNCWSSATTASCNTGCPAPAKSSRCCRSPRPRPTPSGCWSSAPNWPTCSAIISRVREPTGAVPLVRRLRPARMRLAGARPAAVPTPTRRGAPQDQPRRDPQHAHSRARRTPA